MFVYGFANATGAVTDLLLALMRHDHAVAWFDAAEEAAEDRAETNRHTERLFEAFARVPGLETVSIDPPEAPPAAPVLWRAAGAQAEVRAVAGGVAELVEHGVPPERIGIVARELDGSAAPLAFALEELGVPFSARSTTGGRSPFGRRIAALLELLKTRGSGRLERWVDALGNAEFLSHDGRRTSRGDLVLAFRQLGFTRLAPFADAPIERHVPLDRLRLRVRRGFSVHPESEQIVLSYRNVARWALEGAQRAVAELLEHPALRGGKRSVAAFAKEVRDLVRRTLGWTSAFGDPARWNQALDSLGPIRQLELSHDRLIAALETALEPHVVERLGGRGAGVAVLTVMEARSRTFEHLFVLGLNRGNFPRRLREDALLADDVRRALRAVLPDLPVKLEAHDEERYLFAKVCQSAPHVTLSWQGETDEGRAVAPSAFIERLLWEQPERAVEDLAPVLSPQRNASRLTTREQLRRTAVHGSNEAFTRLLEISFEVDRSDDRAASVTASDLAGARAQVLAEQDPRRAPAGLGPYFGRLGQVASAIDPRHNEPFVTGLERFAQCGWQRFLEGILKLEPAPDPLQDLPRLDPRLIGIIVHDALESYVEHALAGHSPERVERWSDMRGRSVEAPVLVALSHTARRIAEERLPAEGFLLPGMVEAVLQLVDPLLERAIQLVDWERSELCGAEVEGRLDSTVAGEPRAIAFRADLVERTPEGDLVLSDFKTGKAFANGRSEKARREARVKSVREASKLQAMAYALAAGGEGRYLFLAEEADTAVVGFRSTDPEIADAFRDVSSTLLEAFEAGAFLPRLVRGKLDKAPDACKFCSVATACHKDDSGYRGRFVRWAEEWSEAQGPSLPSIEERWFQLR